MFRRNQGGRSSSMQPQQRMVMINDGSQWVQQQPVYMHVGGQYAPHVVSHQVMLTEPNNKMQDQQQQQQGGTRAAYMGHDGMLYYYPAQQQQQQQQQHHQEQVALPPQQQQQAMPVAANPRDVAARQQRSAAATGFDRFVDKVKRAFTVDLPPPQVAKPVAAAQPVVQATREAYVEQPQLQQPHVQQQPQKVPQQQQQNQPPQQQQQQHQQSLSHKQQPQPAQQQQKALQPQQPQQQQPQPQQQQQHLSQQQQHHAPQVHAAQQQQQHHAPQVHAAQQQQQQQSQHMYAQQQQAAAAQQQHYAGRASDVTLPSAAAVATSAAAHQAERAQQQQQQHQREQQQHQQQQREREQREKQQAAAFESEQRQLYQYHQQQQQQLLGYQQHQLHMQPSPWGQYELQMQFQQQQQQLAYTQHQEQQELLQRQQVQRYYAAASGGGSGSGNNASAVAAASQNGSGSGAGIVSTQTTHFHIETVRGADGVYRQVYVPDAPLAAPLSPSRPLLEGPKSTTAAAAPAPAASVPSAAARPLTASSTTTAVPAPATAALPTAVIPPRPVATASSPAPVAITRPGSPAPMTSLPLHAPVRPPVQVFGAPLVRRGASLDGGSRQLPSPRAYLNVDEADLPQVPADPLDDSFTTVSPLSSAVSPVVLPKSTRAPLRAPSLPARPIYYRDDAPAGDAWFGTPTKARLPPPDATTPAEPRGSAPAATEMAPSPQAVVGRTATSVQEEVVVAPPVGPAGAHFDTDLGVDGSPTASPRGTRRALEAISREVALHRDLLLAEGSLRVGPRDDDSVPRTVDDLTDNGKVVYEASMRLLFALDSLDGLSAASRLKRKALVNDVMSLQDDILHP